MRIITYNVNGLRSAINKGLLDWLKTDPADVICLQEIKATMDDIDCAELEKMGFQPCFFSANKKGYSGVAILTKIKPDFVQTGHGREQSDFEGRVIRADFGDVTLINAYFPSGTTGDERQTYKYQWLEEFSEYLTELRKSRPKLILVGDYNIAHREIDIHNPKSNKNSSGFLPEERAWMDRFLGAGFIDVFRHFHPDTADHYSWWSYRANSRANNKGWRIDYISATEPLREALKSAAIYPDVAHSDHCPVFAELKLK